MFSDKQPVFIKGVSLLQKSMTLHQKVQNLTVFILTQDFCQQYTG